MFIAHIPGSAIDYKKFIEKHDVDASTKNLQSDNPTDFWISLIENNESFSTFKEEIETSKRKEAQNIIAKIPRFIPKYRKEVITECDEFISDIVHKVGKTNGLEICVIEDSSPNAFCAYSDEGMVVAIASGLLSAKGITENMIIGAVAHEYAHSCLLHILQSELAYNKRQRRNNALKAISAGLIAVEAGVSAYTNTTIGAGTHDVNYEECVNELERKASNDLFKFYYTYSREQEFEADLIAYRFLEWAGYDGANYIEVLKLLEANTTFTELEIEEQIDDTHPTLRDRIAFLTYVKNNPQIENKLNKKLAKKKDQQKKFGNDDVYN